MNNKNHFGENMDRPLRVTLLAELANPCRNLVEQCGKSCVLAPEWPKASILKLFFISIQIEITYNRLDGDSIEVS